MESDTHIIGKQNIRLRYTGDRDPFALRQMIGNICSAELPARLVKLFDQYHVKGHVLRIEKLNINLSLMDDGNLQERLAKEIVYQVEAALLQRLENNTEVQSVEEHFAHTLRFYLEHGCLPQHSSLRSGADLLQALETRWQSEAIHVQVLPQIIPALHSAHARQRLAALLNITQISALAVAAGIWSQDRWSCWQTSLEQIRDRVKGKIAWATVAKSICISIVDIINRRPEQSSADELLASAIVQLFSHPGTLEVLYKHVHELPEEVQGAFVTAIAQPDFPGSKMYSVKSAPQPSEDATHEDKAELASSPVDQQAQNIFVLNAGSILIAPYLPTFLGHLGILNEQSQIADIPKAIHLLRFLVFGHQPFDEMDIVLDKLLCGVPIAQSMDWTCELSDNERSEAESLLQSVVEHWKVLKSTTPAGLRHNFLQREGKLAFKNNQWELTVQKQAHDILLDYLPWSIGMIKLPWMKHLLTVKWN